ncbi:MAG: fibronectin type III domain-containing protein [Candidatus Nanopelagicales bacterium]
MRATLMGLALLVGLLLAPAATPAYAGEGLLRNGPDGRVRAIVHHPTEDITYVGGNFTHWGPQTGGMATVSGSSGALNPNFPAVAGKVLVTMSDDAGGYFIGGQFTAVGGVQRYNAAHVLANGTVDPNWNPVTDAPNEEDGDDAVTSLVRVGSDTLVGGRITLGGTAYGVLRIAPDGTQVPSFIPPTIDSISFGECLLTGPCVRGMAVSGSTLYVGGTFNSFGNLSRGNGAAVDVTTGAVGSWNPRAGGTITAVEIMDDSVVIGGSFTTVAGSTPRSRLAAYTLGGSLKTWAPAVTGSGFVRITAMDVGDLGLYVTGNFSSVAGTGRNDAALLDLDTDAAPVVQDWTPEPNAEPSALQVSGDYVYFAGPFTEIGGGGMAGLARVSATGGGSLDDSWLPDVPASPETTVTGVWPIGAQVVYGGSFVVVGGEEVSRIAAVDSEGELVPGFSGPGEINNEVRSLALDGNRLYLGGAFDSVGGNSRQRIAVIDTSAGQLQSWGDGVQINDTVTSILVHDSVLYVGGWFQEVNASSQRGLAAFDTTTNSADLLSWGNGQLSDGYVNSLLAGPGNMFYVGGDLWFGGPHVYLAAIGVDNSRLSPFPTPVGEVKTLSLADNTLYVGGSFSEVTPISGPAVPRQNVAAIDPISYDVTTWDPSTDGQVTALAADGGVIYVGGIFTSIGQGGGQLAVSGLAAVDELGTPTAWGPALTKRYDQSVYTLAPTGDGGSVDIGGTTSIRDDGIQGTFLARSNSALRASPPTDVVAARGASAGEVDVSWTAPAFTGSDPISGYRVEYAAKPYRTWHEATADTGSTTPTYTVTGLTNGTRYRFRVAALTAAGRGATSAPSNWARAEVTSLLPTAPQNVFAFVDSPGVIHVVGDGPATWGDGASSQAFRAIAWVDGIPMGYCQNTFGAPATLDCLITDLTPGRDYDVTAMALNSLDKWGPQAVATGSPIEAARLFPVDPVDPPTEPTDTTVPTGPTDPTDPTDTSAPSVPPVASPPGSASPSPTVSATPRPSATRSTTTSPTPTPRATSTATRPATTTPTATSSPTATPRPTAVARPAATRVSKLRATHRHHRVVVRATVRPAQGRSVRLQRKICDRDAGTKTCLWRTVKRTHAEQKLVDRVRLRSPKVTGRSVWRIYVPATRTAGAAVSRSIRR